MSAGDEGSEGLWGKEWEGGGGAEGRGYYKCPWGAFVLRG